jgi:hypothetical protein
MSHIVILSHELQKSDKIVYFLAEIAKVWREKDIKVTELFGMGDFVEADIAVMHVNMTYIPPDYLAMIKKYPVVLNADITDISKRHISDNIISSRRDYDGPVIVKTNLNHHGKAESRLATKYPVFGWFSKWLKENIRSHDASRFHANNYSIYDSADVIPDYLWQDSQFVIEKFLPEKNSNMYCLRTWVFLGDKETHSICYSNEPIIKSGNVLKREPLSDVPDQLRQIRAMLGFDYGKFDYNMSGGKICLFDANHTPTLGKFSLDIMQDNIRHLAEGIHSFL